MQTCQFISKLRGIASAKLRRMREARHVSRCISPSELEFPSDSLKRDVQTALTLLIFAQRDPGYKFNMIARATDLGRPPKSNAIDLDIRVVESHKKAPAFLPRPTTPIKLMENYSDFDASIVRLRAVSNVNGSNKSDSSYLVFELVAGRTEQTNKGNTFRYLSIRPRFLPSSTSCKSRARDSNGCKRCISM